MWIISLDRMNQHLRPHLRHVQLVLVLGDLLAQLVHLVRLPRQLRPRLVLPPLGQVTLRKGNVNS